ncbi:DUF6711 family protein [Paenibacillus harenae]|uniref:DUF6711 family protein n=1 Tax=Paenibacillus harenae TaxID=306543 RepID=UPI0003FFF18C|nr:DUF6711 family protein [Paenibacillus harenae]
MALLKINGADLPTPSGYIVTKQDIVKAERNARGTMIKELIASKDKIDLTWIYLTPAQLSQLLAAVSANFFNVTYLEPQSGTNRTATFYAGDRSAPAMDFINGVMRWKDIKFNLIER